MLTLDQIMHAYEAAEITRDELFGYLSSTVVDADVDELISRLARQPEDLRGLETWLDQVAGGADVFVGKQMLPISADRVSALLRGVRAARMTPRRDAVAAVEVRGETDSKVRRAVFILHTEFQSPLDVRVTIEPDVITYDVAPESVERLQRARGPAWRPSRIRVEHPIATDLEIILGGGRMWAELALLLTGLEQEHLLSMGGVRFIDSRSGRVLVEWPRRPPAPPATG